MDETGCSEEDISRDFGKSERSLLVVRKVIELAGEKRQDEIELIIVMLGVLAGIGLVVVMVALSRLYYKLRRLWRGRQQETMMERLMLATLYQAPSRGMMHCDMSCRHIAHLVGETDPRRKRVELQWCGDCRNMVQNKIEEEIGV